MHTIPFSEARTRLAETLSSLDEGGEPVLISRRGQATAVLMSVAQYERLLAQGDGPAARLQAWRAEHENELAEWGRAGDPWVDVRDRRATRSVDWATPALLAAEPEPGQRATRRRSKTR